MSVDGPHRLVNARTGTDTGWKLTAGLALLAIFALGLLIRIAAVAFFAGAIDPEGAEYGRLAENLLAGKGYAGIAKEGTQLFFPPLFPLLLALASLLTGDIKTGGHVITVMAGALMALPAYGIAATMYNRRAALLAAALVASQPFLIFMATTVSVETLFLTVILAAIYHAMLAIDDPQPRHLAASGVLYGLAYLLRPETVAYVIAAAAILTLNLVWRRRGTLRRFAHIGLLLLPFVCLATPYAAWLSLQTGQFRLEGKMPLNVATEIRVQQGEPLYSANFKVDATGQEQGVWNQPSLVTIKAHSLSAGELAQYLATKASAVWQNAVKRLATGRLFGSPLLFVLAVIGLLARPWHPALALHQSHLLAILGLIVISTFFIYYDHPRFYVVALVLFCIWAAAGLTWLLRWGRATGRALQWRAHHGAGLGMLLKLAAFAVLLVKPALASQWLFQEARAERAVSMAGEWLRGNETRPIRLLNAATPLAFHAGAEHVWLPYSDERTALGYIDRKQITHVAVRTADIGTIPYIDKWASGGLPHPRASLVYSFGLGRGETVNIYRIAP